VKRTSDAQRDAAGTINSSGSPGGGAARLQTATAREETARAENEGTIEESMEEKEKRKQKKKRKRNGWKMCCQRTFNTEKQSA
jgi:hypothetical protein